MYSPIDSEAAENQTVVNIVFTDQSAPDIQRKIQKRGGLEENNLSGLVGITENLKMAAR